MYARSFTLLVSLFCATASLASPVPTAAGLALPSSVAVVPVAPSAVGPVVDGAVGTVGEPVDDIVARDALKLPTILQNMVTNVTPFINNLKTAVEDKTNVDVELVKTNLQSIIGVLNATRDELKTFVTNPLALLQGLSSVDAIIQTLAPLLTLVFTVLSLVMGIIANSPLGPVLTPLIAEAGGLVGQIVALVLQVAPGVLAGILPILNSLPLVGQLTSLLSL
ncbi:hypothetical protein BDN70DRAFT_926860 [Pholiota conissans]|uniref:Uncharacterized protein n=1 Tax=Pholiota conissans TaxID=109636 RepID=A0A9P5ZFL0_9AGAR|nr:hypothetical protein BDN70DRAFT_926860 [Pholiota conissans]